MSDTSSFNPFDMFINSHQQYICEDDESFQITLDQFGSDSENASFEEPFASPIFTDDYLINHKRAISTTIAQSSLSFQSATPPPNIHSVKSSVNMKQKPKNRIPIMVGSNNSHEDFDFINSCKNENRSINPIDLEFIPPDNWLSNNVSFGSLVTDFFQRKNNASTRFSHKLFNALKLTQSDPTYIDLVGVSWMNETILKVNKRIFARLLGIKSIEGSFFHQQGNFPSHGFFEIGRGDIKQFCPPDLDLSSVDFDETRILIHSDGKFTRSCKEIDIEDCKWASGKPLR
ncbi:hypothetical protein TRFO_39532 [Tritrichomonas foetus]|uniref:Initiator binding domain-containing protein n=1 Tax=Tritrichomonas foetus TaxID=1144522 RepID=A0A1J4J6H4_9EUKA|nr:hypothetical protein TRFO_39532 [Tritrichomonas foetus]|eukprot:OHS94265.1 hypothetical protein TRFO_39532 [Tritrichomonas foetus]